MPTVSSRQSSAALSPARQRQAAPKPRTDERAQTEVLRRATEVLGEKSAAMRWLGTPVRALGFATPFSLLHDSKGREEVLTVLGRLEHGVL